MARRTAAGDPGSRNTRRRPPRTRRRPRRRARAWRPPDLGERQRPEELAEALEAPLEERAHGLGRAIARRDAGAARHEHGVDAARRDERRHARAQRLRLLAQERLLDDGETGLDGEAPQHGAALVVGGSSGCPRPSAGRRERRPARARAPCVQRRTSTMSRQHGARLALTQARRPWKTDAMSMFGAVKDLVIGRAMRLMSDPRVSRVMGDPRVMNAAMRAMSVGGTVKAEIDRASRFAAGVLGFATQEEVSTLRTTIQTLEDHIAMLESQRDGNGTTASAAPPPPRNL
jgi:hypothetical protein